jgi:hypothetical protein
MGRKRGKSGGKATKKTAEKREETVHLHEPPRDQRAVILNAILGPMCRLMTSHSLVASNLLQSLEESGETLMDVLADLVLQDRFKFWIEALVADSSYLRQLDNLTLVKWLEVRTICVSVPRERTDVEITTHAACGLRMLAELHYAARPPQHVLMRHTVDSLLVPSEFR